MAADAENFYFAKPLDRLKYLQLEAQTVPQADVDANNLASKI